MENYELITGKVYWTKGYEAGVEAEKERMIRLINHPMHHNMESPDIYEDCYTCVFLTYWLK